jgi:predicted membrane chloride channel (bestrophin family)
MAANSAGKGLNGSHVVLEPASEPNPSRERDVHPTVKAKHWGRASRKMEANFKLRRASASLNSKHSVGLHDEESFYEHNPDHDRPQIMGGDNWQAGYKISKHWLTTIAVGAAKKGKLLRYDLARLLHIGGILCIFVKGTVFTMDPWTNIIVMLNMLFGFCVFLFVNWYAVEDPNPEHIEGLAKYMNGIVPFVLALYLSLSISRWWALRTTALGEIFDALSNTAMMFYCYFPGEEFAPMRSCISHYGIASVYLLAAACREKDVCEELVKNNLLSREEAAIVSLCNPFQRPMLLWAWILRITYEAWMLDGKPPPIYGGIQAQVFKARDGIQTVHTYLDTQLPFAYVHLIILLVNLNNLLIGIQSGLKFVVAYRREEYLTLCSEALFLFLVPLCYQGLLTITYIIHDPFGEDMLDFPIMAYTEYVKDTCPGI